MGLPVDKLVICTNDNDVLHRFLETGTYSKHAAVLTIAPSMDISVSSNFERYLFYLCGEDARTLAQWMDKFESTGKVMVPSELLTKAREDFSSYASNEATIVKGMRTLWDKEQYLVCPHTATATVAVSALKYPPATTVCLATAHPAKFEEAVSRALTDCAVTPERPAELTRLFTLPVRTHPLPNSLAAVEKFVRANRLGEKKKWLSWLTLGAVIGIAAVATSMFFALSSRSKRSR